MSAAEPHGPSGLSVASTPAYRARVIDPAFGHLWRAALAPAPLDILDGMADAVFVADGHQRLAYLNRAARDLTGWSGSDALGRPISQFVVGDHSVERPGCRPCHVVTRSGDERPVEASIARLADGRDDSLIIVCRDIGPAVPSPTIS